MRGPLLLGEGGRAKGPDGCGGDPYRSRTDRNKGSPAGRKPSPTGKVDRAKPGTAEGCRTKIAKQATLNGKRFRSTWPVFDFSVVFPHPSRLTACHLPRWGRRPPAGAAFTGACSLSVGVPSTPAAAAAPSPSRRGQGIGSSGNNPQISRKIPAVSLSVRGGKGLDPERGV